MRLLLALLAIVGLLVSPVTASAAQARCYHASGAGMMAGMNMPGMPDTDHSSAQKPVNDPCCDPLGNQKAADKSCAQACAATCGVVAALPTTPISIVFVSMPAIEATGPLVSAHPHEPSGLKRPPKSIV